VDDGPSVRVPVEGSRELAGLASSFNDMAQQLARARAAERAFLVSVSHELKTPLTAIRGYAEGIAEHGLPVDEGIATIQREATRLEALIRDLLDLARMNKSEFTVRREPIDLADAAFEAVQRYDSKARSYDVRLEAVADGSAPAIGDAERMLQVVSNLVENALRVTPPGGSVRVLAAPGSLTVEDTGPGLKAEELPHAFERFYLTTRYRGERRVGTGLGLAIVKQLVEGMGGRVSVTSSPGAPTRFTLRLPVFSAPLESDEAFVSDDVLRAPYAHGTAI
jgi:two-component system, OmpR family, sensor kinase